MVKKFHPEECESTKECDNQPRNVIINQGTAEVDKNILRDVFSLITHSGIVIYFYYTKQNNRSFSFHIFSFTNV